MAGTYEIVKPSLGRLCSHEGVWSELADPDIKQREAVEYGLLYDAGSQCYWQVDAFDRWIKVNEAQARRSLLCNSKVAGGDLITALNHIVTYQNVALAGTLAGYPVGVYRVGPHTLILVTTSPEFIDPVPGDCQTIMTLLRQQLGEEQLLYMLGWLKVGINSVKTHQHMPGQALVLCGVAGSAKTFVQDHLITPLLGGRDAKPYQYMTGATPFNADLFAGEHLVISDENAHTDLASRRDFGTRIKDICVNHRQKLHAKYKTGFMASPFWRLSVSCNDEPENMMILPPMDPSIADKIMLLKVDMPTCLPDDEHREEYSDEFRSELPAFAAYLEEFVIPEELRSSRYGVTHFHHPDLVDALDGLAPEMELLDLIDMDLWRIQPIREVWEGTAAELYSALIGESSQVRTQAKATVRNGILCGRYLTRLTKKKEPRVRQYIREGRTQYLITPP
jgi:hypothetical protein